MSTNQSNNTVLFRPLDSENKQRFVQVIEHSNEHSHTAMHVDFGHDEHKDVRYYPRTFARMEILHKYLTDPFNYADITITNRFTMESTKFTVKFVDDGENLTKCEVIAGKKASMYISQVDASEQLNDIQLVLSMYDFMYGDVCVQFYEDTDHKDQYDTPIIFQFTNAPTVFTGDIYKMLPGDTESTSAIEDYDNVFSSAFGTKSLNKADSGRTNVLLPTVAESECYNDFLSANRLMTNGCIDPNTELDTPRSLSGHPTYVVEYTCVVPSAFASAFGIEQYPVDFVPFNNDEHAYLTLSADDLSAMYKDTQRLSMTTNDNAFTAHSAVTVFSASRDDSATTMDCAIRKYTAYLATSPEIRHNDDWFREHKHLCADFVLSGIDPYWLANTEEFVTDYSYRHYRIIDDYASYETPIAERKWVYHSWGTRYYTLNKGCYADRYNPENWTKIYDYSSNRDMTSVIIPTSTFANGIEVDKDGAPILILEHTGNVTCIDSELVERLVHDRYDESIGKICRFAVSCDDVKDDPYMFKVMSLITTHDRRAVIYRISDMAYPTRSFDDGYNGDGEWALMVSRNV